MIFITIINGILIILAGVAIIKFRKEIKRWTGSFNSVEKYLGRGATYLAIIMFGSGLIILGFFWPFGAQEFIFGVKEIK